MFFNRLYNNKYVFKLHSVFHNSLRYGVGAALRLSSDGFCGYEELKAIFKKNEAVFRLTDKRLNNNAFDFGYSAMGPLINEFVVWIYESSKAYDRLWFLSREGWLLKKAYDLYCAKGNRENKSKYFLTSRRAASFAAIEFEEDIAEILKQYYRGGIKNLLLSRLGLELDADDFYVEMPKDIKRVMEYVDVNSVISAAKLCRQGYLKYIGDHNENIAVVDVGYMGTIQYYLCKMLHKNIDGLYLSSHYKNKLINTNALCRSLYPVINMGDEMNNKVFKNQLFIEAALKAPFGQLLGFNESEAVYDDDLCYDDTVEEVQRGILKFINDVDFDVCNNSLGAELFDCFTHSSEYKEVLGRLSVNDKYCSGGTLKYDANLEKWIK